MKTIVGITFLLIAAQAQAQTRAVDLVNPFLGTAPITDKSDVGFTPPKGMRVWAGLVFPGSSVPNAMVQLSPITKFHSGAGYEYENDTIFAFAHTNKGHWNLCNVPILPANGSFAADDFGSSFSHQNESAHPGYYQVLLERYSINAELTSTLRCAFHKYTYKDRQDKKLVVNLPVSNERVRGWDLTQAGNNVFQGFQQAGEKIYFFARSNHDIKGINPLETNGKKVSVIDFVEKPEPLELKIGFSYVSIANAQANLDAEIAEKSFSDVRKEASETWEKLLNQVEVSGGTQRQREIFYSCLYRSFLWPALRSDVNGEFTNERGEVVNKGFTYYTIPSLWDDYRNKLVLLGMISPDVTVNVIKSLIDRGEITGVMPTFFHADNAAPFIAGQYLRGLRGFDVKQAYSLLLKNATVPGRSRPYLKEYLEKGYISDPDVEKPVVETKGHAGVAKTLEYAYDDYSVALLAKQLGDTSNYDMLMKRAGNYKNMFDPSTGLMRGRLESGEWVKNFNPQYPYYEYMYREANAWECSFFAPHDVEGLIELYKGKEAFESKLDELFSTPWNEKYIAANINSFIGQYCHGNQPDHNYAFLYDFVGKQEKSQAILNQIMSRFYGMGKDGLALCGMDDAGEMSAWYVFSAIGIYPFSPADPEYIVSVPLFDRVTFKFGDGKAFSINKTGTGEKITDLNYSGQKLNGFFIQHDELKKGGELMIATQ